MADTIIIQSNIPVDLIIDAAPVAGSSDLIYATGGGVIFNNILAPDTIADGNQYYGGNPKLSLEDTPVYKKCNKVSVINETITVIAPTVTRGLFVYNNPTDSLLEADAEYLWDEVYTSPIGFHEVIASDSDKYKFSVSGNRMVMRTGDVNIIPKTGDYLIMQSLNDAQAALLTDDLKPYSNSELPSFSDGFSNMPVLFTSCTYQFKITNVSFTAPAGVDTEFILILDKSINVTVGDHWGMVLLNRENTGIQKELFYDTFQQIEIERDQLLGDPYFNLSTALPAGRKNYLYYNGAKYLGIKNLLLNVINSTNQSFAETPFIVYDVSEEIKDRFLPVVSDNMNINFEFHLPTIMLQENENDNLNILTNYGAVLMDSEGVGRYSGLYLKWSPVTGKRYGTIFYDLRIIIIDDAETVMALSYNSNRNYTLPQPIFNSVGNSVANATSNIHLDVVGLINNSGGGSVVVIVNGAHGLTTGTSISISGVKVQVPGTNQIQPASSNGVKFIKRFYTDPINFLGERTDRFYIYEDSSLITGTTGNGEFVNSGVGNSGEVRGATLPYNYFYTYRIKNSTYSSILPYAELTNFNFAASLSESTINNSTGSLFINIPLFTFFQHPQGGFDVTDLEIIIGTWNTDDPSQPFLITGLSDVVVISVQDTATPTLPNGISDLNIVIPKSKYDSYITAIDNGMGAYDFTTNLGGDPNYDIFNNLLHYDITSGTLSETLYTGEGKWTLGNISYKAEVDQFRTKLQIPINADEWNDTTNPSYDATNSFITDKYISEVAICNSDSDTPLIYAKIAPPVKKTADLDLLLNLIIDF